jgi:hypothetical protein
MARQYEFLVAGLPDLLLDDNKNVLTFKAFMGEVAECMEEPDVGVVDAMRLPIDNRNLISVIESKGDFDDRGSLSRELLEDAVKTTENVPKYMRKFLEAHKEGKQLFPGLTPIDQLATLFYEEMAKSKNVFLKDWYDFDLNLRNVVSGINIRKGLTHIEAIGTERDRPGVFTVIGRGDVADAVLKSAAPDFGLTGDYPWVEKLVSLCRGSLTDMEKGIDDIRWETLNELTVFSYFDVEMIAAFSQKLFIVERWLKLEPAAGRVRLDKLVEEMMGSFVMPAGF